MAAGTAHIFERRTAGLGFRLKVLTFAGLFVPLVVGGLVLAYGAGLKHLNVIIAVGAALAIVQAAFALWALVAAWVDGYQRATESVVENHALSTAFESLATDPPHVPDAAAVLLAVLIARDDARRAADYLLNVTDSEKRLGMRAALFKSQRACPSCNVVPVDVQPRDCGVCGNFNPRRPSSPRLPRALRS